MKAMLEIDGFRKEVEIDKDSYTRGFVDFRTFPPKKVTFFHRGRFAGPDQVPLFKYESE